MADDTKLTADEKAQYDWQLSVDGFGEKGQEKLKGATVLISRVGGVGGTLAMHLAAAGIGKLILAHAGNLRLDDLNRQMLMSHAGVGTSRVVQAARKLRELNPHVEVIAMEQNVSEENVDRFVEKADVVAGCAPLFEERLLLNRAAVRQGKALIDCAMYDMDAQLVTVRPGKSACLACLYPNEPPAWKRRFPVLGAVAGGIACFGALEIIKVIAGLDGALDNQMLLCDLRRWTFRKVGLIRNPDCAVCGNSAC